jgi:hypothetical protein
MIQNFSERDFHYWTAREHCRAVGLTDAIHHAPNWQSRADALYAELNASTGEETPDPRCNWGGLVWWDGPGAIGLLADGRMAYVGPWGGMAEVRP